MSSDEPQEALPAEHLALKAQVEAGVAAGGIGKVKLVTTAQVQEYATVGLMLQQGFKEALQARLAVKVKALGVGRNDPCPCASGLKFKKCCRWKWRIAR